MKREITELTVRSPRVRRRLTFAVVADLHNAPFRDVAEPLQSADAILILGDLINRHRRGFRWAEEFLREAPRWAPTFYNIGNHERKFHELEAYWPLVTSSDVTVLDDTFTDFEGVTLGGFSSIWPSGDSGVFRFSAKGKQAPAFLDEMERQPGFRLLMCHHPEYYEPFVRGRDIDLTLAGHAHGGQIRVAGRGLYAPGQGILPRLTSGWYDGHSLYVSRGMTNSARAPRLWDPCELVLLRLVPETEGEPTE